MGEFLANLPGVTDLGAGAIVVLVVIAIIFGRLVPASRIVELKEMYEAQIQRMHTDHVAEKEELRAGNNAYRTITMEQSAQIGELSRAVETSSHAMEAMKEIAVRRSASET